MCSFYPSASNLHCLNVPLIVDHQISHLLYFTVIIFLCAKTVHVQKSNSYIFSLFLSHIVTLCVLCFYMCSFGWKSNNWFDIHDPLPVLLLLAGSLLLVLLWLSCPSYSLEFSSLVIFPIELVFEEAALLLHIAFAPVLLSFCPVLSFCSTRGWQNRLHPLSSRMMSMM